MKTLEINEKKNRGKSRGYTHKITHISLHISAVPAVWGRAVGRANNIGIDQKVYLRVNVICILCMP